MDPDNPALNADGSYKDAAKLEWDHSPTKPSLTMKQKRAISNPSKPTGIKGKHSIAKVPKKRAKPVDGIKALHVESSTSISTRSTSTDTDNHNNSDNYNGVEHTKKKCKKCDCSADVFTIFNWVNPDDITKGYQCKLCM